MLANETRGRLARILMGALAALLMIFCAMVLSGKFMEESAALLGVKVVAVVVSFTGLNGWLRDFLKVHRFIAPALSASGVIVLLMAGGMLGFLMGTLAILYAAGFLWWIYNAVWGKSDPEWALPAALLVIAGYLFWQYLPARISFGDDFAHWGLAAKLLRLNDRFPDVYDHCVRFQGYPLGATVWIYYIVRLFPYQEGFFFAAQNLLSVVLLTPLFLFVNGKKRIALPVTAVFGILIFKFNRYMALLQVDWLLGHFTAAILMVMYYERRRVARMAVYGLVMMLAITMVKNSGLYFSLVGCVLGYIQMRKQGSTKKGAFLRMLSVFAACVVLFLLWNAHVKAAFPATGMTSSHAMSVTRLNSRVESYSVGMSRSQFLLKAFLTACEIALKLLKKWIDVIWTEIFVYSILTAWAIWMIAVRKRNREQFRFLRSWLVGWICMVAGWVVMLFFTYLLSMSPNEAKGLASYNRYINSVVIPFAVMLFIVFLDFATEETTRFTGLGRALTAVVAVALAAMTPLCNGYGPFFSTFGRPTQGDSPWRKNLLETYATHHIDGKGSYLYCSGDTMLANPYNSVSCMRCDLLTNDVGTFYFDEADGVYYYLHQPYFHPTTEQIDDPMAWISEMSENVTWILVDRDMILADQILSTVDNAIPTT